MRLGVSHPLSFIGAGWLSGWWLGAAALLSWLFSSGLASVSLVSILIVTPPFLLAGAEHYALGRWLARDEGRFLIQFLQETLEAEEITEQPSS
jgi:hypothetical protein